MRNFSRVKMILLTLVVVFFAADAALASLAIRAAASKETPQHQLATQITLLRLLRADVKRAREIQQEIPKTKTDCELFENSLPAAGTGYSVISAEMQDLIWVRAQLLVWLDFPLRIVVWRLLRRTAGRSLRREKFSTGKREQLGRLFGRHSVVLWAIRSNEPRRRNYEELIQHSRYSHLQVVRLRSPSEVSAWLSACQFTLV